MDGVPESRGGLEGCEHGFDLVREAEAAIFFRPDERGQVLVRFADRLDHRGAGAGPGDADDVDLRSAIGEGGEQAFDRHAIPAIEMAQPAQCRIGEVAIEQEEPVAAHCGMHPVLRCEEVTLSTFHTPFSRTRSIRSTPQ